MSTPRDYPPMITLPGPNALSAEERDRYDRVRREERNLLGLMTVSGRMNGLVSAIAQGRSEDAHALAIIVSSELLDLLQAAQDACA